MKVYRITINNKLFVSLGKLLLYKAKYSKEGSIKFRNKVIKTMNGLNVFPNSGKKVSNIYRAKVIDGYNLIYIADDESRNVIVVNIVNPRQDSIASKYYY